MFAPDDLTDDRVLGGRLLIRQPKSGYRAAMDPVLLAAAVRARPGQSVLELGCGAGVASLCLATRIPGLTLVGIELQPGYAELARQNAERNLVPFEVICGDLQHMPEALKAKTFDHVVANPPYLAPQAGTPAADPGRERALREETPLLTWLEAGLRRLKPGGEITLILSVDRLPQLLLGLTGRAGDTRVLPVQPREGRAARRILLRARKGAAGPFVLCAPVVLHAGASHLADGDDFTEQARKILRDGGELEI